MISIERPDIVVGQQFIQWTANHQSAAISLPPAAMHLWQYLLRKNPAGIPLEIDLSEELEIISNGRARPYSLRTLKDALTKHLASSKNNLVEIIKDYGKSTFKVIAHHAGPVKEVIKRFGNFSPKTEVKFHDRREISKTEPSNPYSAVPITESLESSTAPAAETKNSLPENQEIDVAESKDSETKSIKYQPKSIDKSTSNEIDSFSPADPHEDDFSGEAEENKNLKHQAKKQTVDPEELRQAIAEVRTIQCTPSFKLNAEIQTRIAENFQNVYSAIAYVKEQIRLGIKAKKSYEAMFMWALEKKLDSKYEREVLVEQRQPTEKDRQDIVIALQNRHVREFYSQPDGLWIVDTGKECLPWYVFLDRF